ncbi:MAG: CinA family nicotinamide mononucleotide deamidase-related protein [Planctomycetota bacterium]|nr:CinA family nicotinamide mononucleotide deamidase-related protein [Planctomycetota bacterium]
MIAEIISIGDELTSGQRLDTNSQWLSQRLGDMGIRTVFHTTVADDLEANIHVFQQAATRADLIISTGGLGPTADDLTRSAVATAFDKALIFDEDSFTHIIELFRKRGREMPDRNRVQAEFPEGSMIVPNPEGSAPGFWLDVTRTGRGPSHVVALPGVPAEMHQMFFQTLESEIFQRLGGQRRVIVHKTIHCFGAGESDIEQRLPDLVRRGRQPSVGITASKATITLRISAEGPDIEACEEKIAPTAQTIHECLGNLIFGEDGTTLEEVVIDRLTNRGESVAVLDAVTGGILGQWLYAADASGLHFLGGSTVRPSTPSQDAASLSDDSADAPLTAAELAEQTRMQWGANWGLAFAKVNESNSPLPEIEIAATNGDRVATERFTFAAHTAIQLPRAAKQALNFLRLMLDH